MSLGQTCLSVLYMLGFVIDLGLHVRLGVLVCGDLLVQLLVLFQESFGLGLELVIQLL